MLRKLWLIAAAVAFLCGSAEPGQAQDELLDELYGQGVHAYHSGMYSEAYQFLSAAIEQGIRDPRCYYYRGLTAARMGNSAEGDFELGAQLEAQGALEYASLIGRSLERIQGPIRMQLERTRQQARLEVLAAEARQTRDLYQQRQAAEAEVLRPKQPVPSDPPPLPEDIAGEESDPFTQEGAPAVTPAPVAPADPAPPAGDDPFGAPADPAPPAGDDPFGAPADPAPPAGDDPFGAPADPAPPAGDDPFGAPADPAPPAADDPFGAPADPAPPAGDDPFGAPADPAPPAGDDPFGAPADPAPPAGDNPFAFPGEEPEMPAPAGGDPFGAAPQPAVPAGGGGERPSSPLGSIFRAVGRAMSGSDEDGGAEAPGAAPAAPLPGPAEPFDAPQPDDAANDPFADDPFNP